MTRKPRAAISWSGGKDSCAALHRAHLDYDVVAMVTMCDEDAARSRSHGLRPEVLDAQAERLGLRRVSRGCTWPTYSAAFRDALGELVRDGITHVIFGDILFEEHRRWAEEMCAPHGLTAVEPLFGLSTTMLFEEWTASGADAIIVTARAEFLDATWLGRPLRREMLDELTRLGVDPCGERGSSVERSGCWALDVTLVSDGVRHHSETDTVSDTV